MPLNLGDTFPNFTVDTTKGRITYHDHLGSRYVDCALANIFPSLLQLGCAIFASCGLHSGLHHGAGSCGQAYSRIQEA